MGKEVGTTAQAVHDISKAVESRIDIRPLVAQIIEEFDGLQGLGRAAKDLYDKVQSEQVQARLMCEILSLVRSCTQEEEETPDDIGEVEREARELMGDGDGL